MLPRPPLNLASLTQTSAKSLRALWSDWFDTPPPAHVRHSLLVRALAYRMQEREHGGLSPATRKDLRARADGSHHPLTQMQGSTGLTPGTHVIREWGKEMHQVTVETAGLVYRGQRYRSLSAIARKITGTRWSGPVFFGIIPPQARPFSKREVER
jgi:hypothetical protein